MAPRRPSAGHALDRSARSAGIPGGTPRALLLPPTFSATSPTTMRRRRKPAGCSATTSPTTWAGWGPTITTCSPGTAMGKRRPLSAKLGPPGTGAGQPPWSPRICSTTSPSWATRMSAGRSWRGNRENGATAPVIGCPHGVQRRDSTAHPAGTGPPVLGPAHKFDKAAAMERLSLDRFRLEGFLGSGSDYEVHAAFRPGDGTAGGCQAPQARLHRAQECTAASTCFPTR